MYQKLSYNLILGFLDFLPNLVIVKNEDLNYVYANVKFLTLFNLSPKEILGKTDFDFFSQYSEESSKNDKFVLESGIPFESEINIPNLNRDMLIFHSQKSLHIDENNHKYVLEILTDLTEKRMSQKTILEMETDLLQRMRMEELVQEISNQFINISLEKIDIAIQEMLSSCSQFINVDESYLALVSSDYKFITNWYHWPKQENFGESQDRPLGPFHWSVSKFLNSELIEFTSLDEIPIEGKIEKKMWESMGIQSLLAIPLHIENQLIGFWGFSSKSKQRQWLENDIFLLRLIGELLINVISRQRAEVQRKRAEYELLERNRFIQAITETVPDIIFVYNLNSRKNVYLNRSFTNILGYSMEDIEWVSDEFIKAISGEKENNRCYEVIKNNIKDLRHGEHIYFETRFYHKMGELRWLSGNYLLFSLNSDNSPKEILGTASDITKQKNVELDLLFAKSKAEEANRTKSQFLSSISHELRTPLNGILGYAQILKNDTTLNQDQKRGLQIIKKSGTHLLHLINDILDISKIESGKMEITCEPFSLKSSLQDIIPVSELKAQNKELDFIYEIPENLPDFINGDERRIIQVVMNLLDNAIKFTDSGQVCFRLLRENDVYHFFIEDTGIGIEESKIKEIFEPFKQLSSPLKKVEGTGLGLAISQKLVELMGGELKVQSKLGKGTNFVFSLNLPKEDNPKYDMDKNEFAIDGYLGDRVQLLVVDDSDVNRFVLRDFLKGLGFDILEATNGKEAYDKVLENDPKLILMDLVMPEMNGFEAVELIRNIPGKKGIKIIAVSANLSGGTLKNPGKYGFDDFIPKPIFQNGLFQKLRKHLDLHWTFKNVLFMEKRKPTNLLHYTLPPQEILNEICRFISLGDIDSLKHKLNCLRNKNPDYEPLLNKLNKLAEEFKLKELHDFAIKYLKN
ncbi:MAG: response regulator [Leptospiraceae bacterium]|nr:response regulator [Leptospiraceae bacterium]MCP5494502.1 response regulator [Leptospiraceae bacterium]